MSRGAARVPIPLAGRMPSAMACIGYLLCYPIWQQPAGPTPDKDGGASCWHAAASRQGKGFLRSAAFVRSSAPRVHAQGHSPQAHRSAPRFAHARTRIKLLAARRERRKAPGAPAGSMIGGGRAGIAARRVPSGGSRVVLRARGATGCRHVGRRACAQSQPRSGYSRFGSPALPVE